VVTRVQPGDFLRTGQRIGLMKFGSRMDVFVPPHVDLVAAAGDRTTAGESVIARWPSPAGTRPGSPR
jgi:phosphatidylserine decarboxylase